MALTVEVAGLSLFGYHGVEEREREEGQRFLVDLWLEVPEQSAESDRIEDAVDYREVVRVVQEVSGGSKYQLLEALAARIAEALVARFPLESARVRVRKPDVRLELPVDFTAATAERRRA
ncbi:MAG: dihydroneopterin aldolase [Gaiellaceae bacterium]